MNVKSILVVLACLVACQQGVHGVVWTKINRGPVCFEARNRKPGTFIPRLIGFIAAVKLVHRSGKVTCDYRLPGKYSNWGCHNLRHIENYPLNVLITDQNNQIIFPKVGATFTSGVHRKGRWYRVPGFNSKSKILVLQHGFNAPFYAGLHSRLKLWYGEDLFNYATSDNRGHVCADVYGHFV